MGAVPSAGAVGEWAEKRSHPREKPNASNVPGFAVNIAVRTDASRATVASVGSEAGRRA